MHENLQYFCHMSSGIKRVTSLKVCHKAVITGLTCWIEFNVCMWPLVYFSEVYKVEPSMAACHGFVN